MNGAESKAELRRQLTAALRQLSPAERQEGSAAICARLLAQPVWAAARSILLFAPFGQEPDISPLIGEALRAGKSVSLPRHKAESDLYGAVRLVTGLDECNAGRFGISEPPLESPAVTLNELDFVLVPGLGFALDGGRLGRGRGDFDRLLAAVPGFKCGVGFDCQIVPDLPMEPHDVHLHCILTPTRWHLTGCGGRS